MQLKYEKEHLHAGPQAFQTTYNSNICLPLPRSHFSLFGSNSLRLCLFSVPKYPPQKNRAMSVPQGQYVAESSGEQANSVKMTAS